MTVKRKDFQKASALIHEFLLKLSEDSECAELRDALNLSLLHMQRYYRKLRVKLQQNQEKQNGGNGHHVLSQSLRGLSPMTPFRDAPDKFQWKWVNLESPKVMNTLPVDLNKELSMLPLIIQASKEGDNDMLMQHIERDPDCVFEVDALGRNALMYAVNCGHLDTVQILLENGVEVNATAADVSTAAHRACHNGNHEALQILVGYDADLEIVDSQGRYPIHWACAHPSRDCLQLLIERKVTVTVRDQDGMTPSMWACRMDNIDHFEILSSIDNQEIEEEDGYERDLSKRTWMHWSVRRAEPLECLKTLLTEDSACLQDEDGRTVIHIAAEMGSLPAVKIILEIAGEEVINQRDFKNRTALTLATMGGHGEIVNFLLTQRADLACVDETGATAWDYACTQQLHYCMLILASYIRQQAKNGAHNGEIGDGDGDVQMMVNGTMEDTLGLNHLQINGEDKPMLHGHRPIPPPHPRTEPHTPRTPRTGRPKTPATPKGVYTPNGHNYGEELPVTPHAPVTPTGGNKPHGGVKRSPSTPDANDNEVFFEKNKHRPSSSSNKRLKNNDQSPDREALMSVMSLESPDHVSSSRIGSAQSLNRQQITNQDQVDGLGAEPEMANDSQYVDNADDDNSRVSIDAMDVSDFEGDADGEEEDGVDEGDGDSPDHPQHPNAHNYPPSPSPRPPPQPNPRLHQNHTPNSSHSNQSPRSPKSPPAHSQGRTQGAAPTDSQGVASQKAVSRGKLGAPHYSQSRNQQANHIVGNNPSESSRGYQDDSRGYQDDSRGYQDDSRGYQDDPRGYQDGRSPEDDLDEVDAMENIPEQPVSRPAQIHFPSGHGSGRAIPPAHLSPLSALSSSPPAPAPKRKKKKKKKERQEIIGNEDFPQTRGYVAPIPPPLHQAQPSPPHPQPREKSPPRGGGGGGMVGERGRGMGNSLQANVRPSSGSAKPTPKKRSSSLPPEQSQRFALDPHIKVAKPMQKPGPLSGSPNIISSSNKSRLSALPSSNTSRVPSLPQAQPRLKNTSNHSLSDPHPKYNDSQRLAPQHRRMNPPRHSDDYQASDEEYDDRGHASRSSRQAEGPSGLRGSSGKTLAQNGAVSNGMRGNQPAMLSQNGPIHKRSPTGNMGNRREPSPSPTPRTQNPPSPRNRRPPSGSLGALSPQGAPPWSKKQLPNGRLPPSH